MHTYGAMTVCADESNFEEYYRGKLKMFYADKFLNQEFITPNYGYSTRIIRRQEQAGFFNVAGRGFPTQKVLVIIFYNKISF